MFKVEEVLDPKEDCHSVNSKGAFFTNVKPILEADEESLVFIDQHRKDKYDLIRMTKAGVIITSWVEAELFPSKCFIIVTDPRKFFIRLANRLFLRTEPKIVLGSGLLLQEYVTIGSDGFGYDNMIDGKLTNFPQLGGVIIGDDVHIHAHTNIDRGTLGDTVIGDGTKIDKHCHIGHNTRIGKNCIICAGTILGGSTVIDDFVFMGLSCTTAPGIHIGKAARINMGSVVTRDVNPCEHVAGNWAIAKEKFIEHMRRIR
jgi:UDP-3-O-[3-hydroxymyristoyl] glucosamine N-acyltransferase